MMHLVTELEFCDFAEDYKNNNYGTLSFTWMFELKEGDEVRLKTTHGRYDCATVAICTFNGKFIRGI